MAPRHDDRTNHGEANGEANGEDEDDEGVETATKPATTTATAMTMMTAMQCEPELRRTTAWPKATAATNARLDPVQLQIRRVQNDCMLG